MGENSECERHLLSALKMILNRKKRRKDTLVHFITVNYLLWQTFLDLLMTWAVGINYQRKMCMSIWTNQHDWNIKPFVKSRCLKTESLNLNPRSTTSLLLLSNAYKKYINDGTVKWLLVKETCIWQTLTEKENQNPISILESLLVLLTHVSQLSIPQKYIAYFITVLYE